MFAPMLYHAEQFLLQRGYRPDDPWTPMDEEEVSSLLDEMNEGPEPTEATFADDDGFAEEFRAWRFPDGSGLVVRNGWWDVIHPNGYVSARPRLRTSGELAVGWATDD